ncbi:MAG: hypothetical protein HY038_02610 [Nitrospirae bacterium]|nr:hypothetical protein [Nitrospirota bacterium]
MKVLCTTSVVLTLAFLMGCSSTEWVHPQKPSSEYGNEYSRCQGMVLGDPKLQQGDKLLVINATERCMRERGWRMIERE